MRVRLIALLGLIGVAGFAGYVGGAAHAVSELPVVSVFANESDALRGEIAINHPSIANAREIAALICGGDAQVEVYENETALLVSEWIRFECAQQRKGV